MAGAAKDKKLCRREEILRQKMTVRRGEGSYEDKQEIYLGALMVTEILIAVLIEVLSLMVIVTIVALLVDKAGGRDSLPPLTVHFCGSNGFYINRMISFFSANVLFYGQYIQPRDRSSEIVCGLQKGLKSYSFDLLVSFTRSFTMRFLRSTYYYFLVMGSNVVFSMSPYRR